MRSLMSGLLLSVAALTLAALQPGCADGAAGTIEGQDPGAPTASEAISADHALVALTAISADRTPVLSHLAGAVRVMPADGLLAALDAPGADPAQILGGATAIAADMDQLAGEDLAPYRRVIDAARKAGIPFVMENVHEASRMAAVFGYGVVADAAIVEPSRGGQKFTITVYGGDRSRLTGTPRTSAQRALKSEGALRFWQASPEEQEAIARESGLDPSELGAKADQAIQARDDEATAQEGEATAIENAGLAPSKESIADQVTARVIALASAPKPLSLTTSSFPMGTYLDFVIQSPFYWTVPGTSQTATIDVGYEVQLVASSAPTGKFMVVSNAGSGVNPGAFGADDQYNRGFFQEAVNVNVQPGSAPLSAYLHSPNTPNAQNSFTTTNGCSFGGQVGTDAASTSFSCNVENSASVSLSDFSAVDYTTSTSSFWSYTMTSASGNSYSGPNSLIGTWGMLNDLPWLAKSTLVPAFETIYRADVSYQGSVPLTFVTSQRLNHVWIDYHVFWDDVYHQSYTETVWRSGAADFSQVSLTDVYVPFINKNSGLTMDVYYSETDPGAPIIQWPATGNPNQQFELVPTLDGDGSVFIKPRHSGLCFDILYSSVDPGAQLIQWTCTGNPNQKFLLRDVGGYKSIQNKNSGLCLSVAGASLSGYAAIVQEPCNTALNEQLFRLQ